MPIHWQEVRQNLKAAETDLHRKVSRDVQYWQDLLQQRAQQLSERTSSESIEVEPCLVFWLTGEKMFMPIKYLKEIAPFVNCRALPLAPPELLGVCPHRGQMVSVLDLGHMLRLGSAVSDAEQEHGYVLFLRTLPQVGLRVVQIGAVHDLPQTEVQQRLYLEHDSEPQGLRAGTVLDLEILLKHSLFQGKIRHYKE